MKRFLLIFLLFLNSIPIFCTDQLDLILSEEIKHLEDRGGKPLVVSLTGFYFEDKQLGSSFSRYLEEKLSKTLANSAEFELFAKEKLEEILATIEISLTDLFESETAVRVGHLKGIQALIGGRYFDEGDRIRIFLDLINLETGTVTRKREFIIQKRFVPPTISLLPDNYTNALYVLNQLTDVVSAEKGELDVKVWITRGNGST
ncbi:MAG TPA: hypothetical protein VMX75_09060, partial [Spirochaetia bacterium]|nr:hypothetical protein [Spirochaetia bacterium]